MNKRLTNLNIDKDAQELSRRFDTLFEEASRNEIKLKMFQAYELELMNAGSLNNLIEILLKESQTNFGWDMINLTLLDPDYEIRRLLEGSGFTLSDYPELIFINNGKKLEKYYNQRLLPVLKTYSDDEHYSLFSSKIKKPDYIWSLPLNRNYHLVGSYSIGKQSDNHPHEKSATDFLQHLAAVISVCLEISITRERLQHLGLIDPLTGINNRRFFDQRLIEEVTSVNRANVDISCLFIDIDHFKKINDNHGHQAGDIILKDVAQIIRELVRSNDVVARYGGEEFIVLLSHKGKQKAIEIAERIRETIEKRTFLASQSEKITVTTSIGINTLKSGEHDGDVNEIALLFVKRADRALYQAKDNGRNRTEFYTASSKPQ